MSHHFHTLTFYFAFFVALVCFSEEVRSRCHVKHTVPRWPVESGGSGDSASGSSSDPSAPNSAGGGPLTGGSGPGGSSGSGGHSVRRQKSWDMLDQSAIQYARQSHKVQQHQVGSDGSLGLFFVWVLPLLSKLNVSDSHNLLYCAFRILFRPQLALTVELSFRDCQDSDLRSLCGWYYGGRTSSYQARTSD